MELQEAIDLLDHKKFKPQGIQHWYDLGAGTGIFTMALAHMLSPGSSIISIDHNGTFLKNIPDTVNSVAIKTVKMDFESTELPENDFDGILMANSIHYVDEKEKFIERMRRHLKPSHDFLIVEYDTERQNAWVPYPLSFIALRFLFEACGYQSIIKLNERPSRYNSNMMYSAIIES